MYIDPIQNSGINRAGSLSPNNAPDGSSGDGGAGGAGFLEGGESDLDLLDLGNTSQAPKQENNKKGEKSRMEAAWDAIKNVPRQYGMLLINK